MKLVVKPFIISYGLETSINSTFITKLKDINFNTFCLFTLFALFSKSNILINKTYKKFIAFQIIISVITITLFYTLSINLFIVPFITLCIWYIIHFIKKEKKEIIDILKLLFIVAFSCYILFYLKHYPISIVKSVYYLSLYILIVYYWILWLKQNLKR